MKRVKIDGKVYHLPDTMAFEGLSRPRPLSACFPMMAFYEITGMRPPRKNEWYVSGAKPQAWKAHSNLTQSFLIAVPTYEAKTITVDVKGRKLW